MPTDSKVPPPQNTFLSNSKNIHIIPKTKIAKRGLQRRFRKRHEILRFSIKPFYGLYGVRVILFFTGFVYTFFPQIITHSKYSYFPFSFILLLFLCFPPMKSVSQRQIKTLLQLTCKKHYVSCSTYTPDQKHFYLAFYPIITRC